MVGVKFLFKRTENVVSIFYTQGTLSVQAIPSGLKRKKQQKGERKDQLSNDHCWTVVCERKKKI